MSWRTSVELIADRESNDCKHPANGWTKLLFGIWAGTPHVPIMNSGSDRTWRHKSRGPVLIYLFNHRSGIPAQYGIHDGKYAINIPEFRTIYRLEFSNKTSGLELRCVTNVLIIPSPPPSSPPTPAIMATLRRCQIVAPFIKFESQSKWKRMKHIYQMAMSLWLT